MAGLGDSYLDAIRRFEGFNPNPYWDYRQWTSGYGTRAGGPNEVIDRPEADRRLQTELGNASGRVDAMGVPMTPGQRAALTSLTFNAGPSWMNSGLGSAVRSGDWGTARQRFMQYVNAGGRPLPGLQSRRAEEATWFDQPANQPGATDMTMTRDPQQGLLAGLLSALMPQAQAATSGAFAPRRPTPDAFGGDWSLGGALPSDTPAPPAPAMPPLPIAPPGPRTRAGAPYRPLLPPTGAVRSGWRPPGAVPSAPMGVPMPGGGIGSDFAASPPLGPPPTIEEPLPITPMDPDAVIQGAQAAHSQNNPPGDQPGFMAYLDRLARNPAFIAGLSTLGGANPGQSLLQAQHGNRQQLEFDRQQKQRSTMDRLWAQAFPNGQPNTEHPLLQGQSPQVAAMIAGLGPDVAIPMLARSAMERRQLEFKTVGDQAFIFDPRTGHSMAVPGVSPKPPEAIRTQGIKADQAYRNLSTALDDYEKLVRRTGAVLGPGRNLDAVTQARTNIQLQLKELYNLGVLNGPDLDLMQKMLVDPTIGLGSSGLPNLVPGNAASRVSAGIARLKEILRTMRNNQTEAIGLPPVPPPAAANPQQQQRVRIYNPQTGELEWQPAANDPLGIR